jgi:hypothetical protein
MFKLSYLLLAIVILSALLFGSVEPWSIALIGILTAVVFICFVIRFPGPPEGDFLSRQILLSMTLVFAYGLLQLIPVPVSVLNLVHPKIAYLFSLPPSIAPGPDVSRDLRLSLCHGTRCSEDDNLPHGLFLRRLRTGEQERRIYGP